MTKPKTAARLAAQDHAEVVFAKVVAAMTKRHPDVTPPSGLGPNFGRNALKIRGKLFAMPVRGSLVVKLPKARVAELVASGVGVPFDANKGRPMKEWIAIAEDEDGWLGFAEEAYAFVKGLFFRWSGRFRPHAHDPAGDGPDREAALEQVHDPHRLEVGEAERDDDGAEHREGQRPDAGEAERTHAATLLARRRPGYGSGVTAPRYPFLHVDVPQALSEDVAVLLFELGAEGVEERDQTTLQKGTESLVTLVAAFATREAAEEALAQIDDDLAPRIEEIVGDAWRDAWKEHYRPFALTPRITVRPPWEPYERQRDDEMVLELEPGRAFGTGLHATTSLVARALDRARDDLRGTTVLDVGTGSGILALVALLFGAERAIVTDVDPDAIAVARENAARNGLADRLASADDLAALGTFPIVLANIEAFVLTRIAADVSARVEPGGLLVLSGILVGQENDVKAAYPGFAELGTETEGEWVAISLRKNA